MLIKAYTKGTQGQPWASLSNSYKWYEHGTYYNIILTAAAAQAAAATPAVATALVSAIRCRLPIITF